MVLQAVLALEQTDECPHPIADSAGRRARPGLGRRRTDAGTGR